MPSTDYPAIAIVGPTGSGKTRLGMIGAARFRGEIVSCDALQVYRHMDIGTAKATKAEQEFVRHHMLDLRAPDENFSAGDYQRLAREALRTIRGRAHLPFVVGGTGFYLRALIDGLFEGPGRSEALRRRMQRIVKRKGVGRLYRALIRVDPAAAARIAPTDLSRIIRAYEVYLTTGKPMSWWQQQPTDILTGFRWLKMAIAWPREILYRRINTRVEEMFKSGFVDEVRALLKEFPRDCHPFKAIGYRQVAEHVDGKISLEQAIAGTQQESRHYAKRQLTWFRSKPEIIWLDGNLDWEALQDQAIQRISEFLQS